MAEDPIQKLAVTLSAVATDVKWIKETLHKKANKWVERVLGVMMLGATGWVIGQLLETIQIAKALMN